MEKYVQLNQRDVIAEELVNFKKNIHLQAGNLLIASQAYEEALKAY
jgi:hypothetical protein